MLLAQLLADANAPLLNALLEVAIVDLLYTGQVHAASGALGCQASDGAAAADADAVAAADCAMQELLVRLDADCCKSQMEECADTDQDAHAFAPAPGWA